MLPKSSGRDALSDAASSIGFIIDLGSSIAFIALPHEQIRMSQLSLEREIPK
jgi:hypothetical protein